MPFDWTPGVHERSPESEAILRIRRERDIQREELVRLGINPDDHKPELWASLIAGKTKRNRSAEKLVVASLTDYDVKAVEWLEKPMLQRSAFHLLAGRKGTCKGTWLCGLAARVTTGRMYNGTAKKVLVVTSEDSIALDFKPRFLAAGGIEEAVKVVNGPFRIPRDLEWLKETAHSIGNLGLVVIDPIGNHLGGADTDKEGSVREAIGPLNYLADELETLIMGVRHLSKDASRGASASVLGSTAWVDVPRSVLLMAADDEDDMLFHIQVVHGNRGPKNSGLKFRLTIVDVPPAKDITKLVGEGESTKDVEELLAAKPGDKVPASASAKAREMILDLLETNGRMESDALDIQVSQAVGVSTKTVQNIRGKLKKDDLIRNSPEKDEQGSVVRWYVQRTITPRRDKQTTLSEPHPVVANGTNEKPHNQATSRPTSLESVSTGSGSPHPDQSEQGSGSGTGYDEYLFQLAEEG